MLPKSNLLSFIDKWVRPIRPDLEPSLLAAIDALESGTHLPEPTIQSLADAASSERIPIYELSASLLGELAERNQNALEAVRKMAKARQAHVRHNAVLCMTEKTPREVCIEIIRGALIDKSLRVRRKGADWAFRLKLKAIVPDLEKAEACESNEDVRSTIAFGLRMLRDGYVVDVLEGGVTFVTVENPSGGTTGFQVQPGEIELRGIALIVSEFQAGLRKKH